MTQVQILPPAAKFLKKLKDKKLKSLYKEAIEMICEDYSIGEEKTGDLAGMYGYDIYYNKTNYELAYRVRQLDDLIIRNQRKFLRGIKTLYTHYITVHICITR